MPALGMSARCADQADHIARTEIRRGPWHRTRNCGYPFQSFLSKQHFLYFLPDPQGHGAFCPAFSLGNGFSFSTPWPMRPISLPIALRSLRRSWSVNLRQAFSGATPRGIGVFSDRPFEDRSPRLAIYPDGWQRSPSPPHDSCHAPGRRRSAPSRRGIRN